MATWLEAARALLQRAALARDSGERFTRIASITKTFVWTAVMQLVEGGQLELDADVNEYLDFTIPQTFPEPITLKHLMTHTPGFEDAGSGRFAPSADELPPFGEHLAAHVPRRVRPPALQTPRRPTDRRRLSLLPAPCGPAPTGPR